MHWRNNEVYFFSTHKKNRSDEKLHSHTKSWVIFIARFTHFSYIQYLAPYKIKARFLLTKPCSGWNNVHRWICGLTAVTQIICENKGGRFELLKQRLLPQSENGTPYQQIPNLRDRHCNTKSLSSRNVAKLSSFPPAFIFGQSSNHKVTESGWSIDLCVASSKNLQSMLRF